MNVSRAYITLVFVVVGAPLLFFVYLQNGWVCAPRALAAASIFGGIPLVLATFALLKQRAAFYYAALAVLAVETLITPVIMLNRLGWAKLWGERALAFFSFEMLAVVQIALIILAWRRRESARSMPQAACDC